MRKNYISNGGYVGIIILLLGVAIIIFIIIKTDLFSLQKNNSNILEKSQDYVNSAKDVKNLIERNN